MNISKLLCKLILRGLIFCKFIKPYQPIPDLRIKIASHRERSVFNRWNAIKNELGSSGGSFLDVGCNVGFYVLESSKLGYISAGLDFPRNAFALTLASMALDYNNVFSMPIRLNPDNVNNLPKFDVIMALQVFHHFHKLYGRDNAIKILNVLWRKTCSKLFIEIENSFVSESDDALSAEDWVLKYFPENGASKTSVIYRDKNRNRVLIVAYK